MLKMMKLVPLACIAYKGQIGTGCLVHKKAWNGIPVVNEWAQE